MISSTLDPFLHFPVLWNVGSIITIANYLLIRVSIPYSRDIVSRERHVHMEDQSVDSEQVGLCACAPTHHPYYSPQNIPPI